jgi:hypothetical protein
MFIRGEVRSHQLGSEAGLDTLDEEETARLRSALAAFTREFGIENVPDPAEFTKLYPKTSRPYGRLYAY